MRTEKWDATLYYTSFVVENAFFFFFFWGKKSYISLTSTSGTTCVHTLMTALRGRPQHLGEMAVHWFTLTQIPLALIIPLSGSNLALMWVRGHIIEMPLLCHLISLCVARFLPSLDRKWMSQKTSNDCNQIKSNQMLLRVTQTALVAIVTVTGFKWK